MGLNLEQKKAVVAEVSAQVAKAQAIIVAWSRAENFGLYEDVLPCLEALRAVGIRMALLSNALGHGVEEIVAH